MDSEHSPKARALIERMRAFVDTSARHATAMHALTRRCCRGRTGAPKVGKGDVDAIAAVPR